MTNANAVQDAMNNLIATGGILASLRDDLRPEVVMNYAGGQMVATNKIRVYLPFMHSPYILTIEQDVDDQPF